MVGVEERRDDTRRGVSSDPAAARMSDPNTLVRGARRIPLRMVT
jgi:hypothetical protein